jgi:hypothetical protein
MSSLKISLISLVALCGCTGQAPSAKSGAQSAAPLETPPALAPNAYPVPEAATPTISDADRPKTIDEFREQFVRLYNQDMYAPFIELAYWGSSTNEQKKKYLSDVKAIFTLNSIRVPAYVESTAQLEATPIEQIDVEDRYVYYPRQGEESIRVYPEPTHRLSVYAYLLTKAEAKARNEQVEADDGADEGDDGIQASYDDRGTVSAQFAVGVHEGKYYFCTFKHD